MRARHWCDPVRTAVDTRSNVAVPLRETRTTMRPTAPTSPFTPTCTLQITAPHVIRLIRRVRTVGAREGGVGGALGGVGRVVPRIRVIHGSSGLDARVDPRGARIAAPVAAERDEADEPGRAAESPRRAGHRSHPDTHPARR